MAMAMAMANSALLLHQRLLAERPTQSTIASGHSCQCTDAFLQTGKLWKKSNGAFIRAAPRDLQCKAQAQDGRRALRNASKAGLDQSEAQFAAGTLGAGSETTAVGTAPPLPSPPPPPTYIGSPLLWIGVGVGISALFSWAANNLKRYAMQQMFKTMMGQATPDGSQFRGMPMTRGPVFPVPPLTTPPRASSPSTETVDVSATQVTLQSGQVNGAVEAKVEPAKPDTSPQGVLDQKSNGERAQESSDKDATKRVYFKDSDVSHDGSFMQPDGGATYTSPQSTDAGKAGSILSVEALEKMMEDPTVQKMVYPYLPEEMRNPATFKWMLQNPQYRQQLEEMLKSMGGDEAWDNRIMDSLKSFDLSSQEVKQQFEQIGLTPEEVVAKIMANPEVAMAFQSPKVQAAIMDCSQNPLSITKYQNDKEVMDVFNKISELFPGMTGSP